MNVIEAIEANRKLPISVGPNGIDSRPCIRIAISPGAICDLREFKLKLLELKYGPEYREFVFGRMKEMRAQGQMLAPGSALGFVKTISQLNKDLPQKKRPVEFVLFGGSSPHTEDLVRQFLTYHEIEIFEAIISTDYGPGTPEKDKADIEQLKEANPHIYITTNRSLAILAAPDVLTLVMGTPPHNIPLFTKLDDPFNFLLDWDITIVGDYANDFFKTGDHRNLPRFEEDKNLADIPAGPLLPFLVKLFALQEAFGETAAEIFLFSIFTKRNYMASRMMNLFTEYVTQIFPQHPPRFYKRVFTCGGDKASKLKFLNNGLFIDDELSNYKSGAPHVCSAHLVIPANP